MGKLVLVGLILESEFDRDRLVGYLNDSLNDNSYFLNSLYHENLYDYCLVDCLCGIEEYCDNVLLAYDCAIVNKVDSDLVLPDNIKTARIVNYSRKNEFNIVFPPSLEILRIYLESFGILKDSRSIPNITLVFRSSVSNSTLEELTRYTLKIRPTLKVLEGSIFKSREAVIRFLDEMICKVKFY